MSQIAQQIKELEDMLDSGLINDETIIKETKASIADLKAKQAKASTQSDTPKKVYKKDFYAAMDKEHSELSQAKVKSMKQADYEKLVDQLEKAALAMGVTKKQASDYAESYLSKHLPKGTIAHSKPKSKTVSLPDSIGIKQIRVLDYTLSPGNKNLELILRAFVERKVDGLREQYNIVRFEKQAVVATDAMVLIRIKGETDKQGNFCVTSQCYKKIEDPNSITYPNYESIINYEDEGERTNIDVVDLIKVVDLFHNFKKDNSQIVLQIKVGKYKANVDADKLSRVLKALVQIGYTEVAISMYGDERAMAFYPVGDKHPGLNNKTLALLMPMSSNESIEKWKLDLKSGKINVDQPNIGNTTIKSISEKYPIKVINPKSKKKTSPSVKKTASTDNEKVAYSWKRKEEVTKLSPVVLHCQHYSKKVDKAVIVRLKGSGPESIEVKALPGEHLIFDDKGYLVFIMNANSFSQKCNENTSLEDHTELKHQAKQADKLKAEKEKLQQEITRLKAAQKEDKKPTPKASKSTPQLKATPKPTSQPKPAAPKPSPTTENPKPKRHKCTAEELSTAQLIAKVMKFVEQNSIKWTDIFNTKQWSKTKEIEGIYELKGDGAGKIIVKMRDWNAKAKKDQVKWYSLCIDSYRLTKIEPPAQNTYKRVISQRQLKAAYTTKGVNKYKRCASLHSELAKCRAKGNCTTSQKEKYSKQVSTCGNLGKSKVAVPTFISYLHKETRRQRRAGEEYSAALSRVAGEIRSGE